MFYFTIIAVVCFFVMVLRQLVDATTDLGSLPVLSDGFVAVLGISHGGYLTSKSINHTKSQP
jgi:dipeptidyl aminopeptidase/acylaminoacyl peptidase